MRKLAFCICENKGADQLRGNREADQRLCFRHKDSAIPLLSKSEISSLKPSCVIIQPGLYRTWSETPSPVFSQRGSTDWHHQAFLSTEVLSLVCMNGCQNGCVC